MDFLSSIDTIIYPLPLLKLKLHLVYMTKDERKLCLILPQVMWP